MKVFTHILYLFAFASILPSCKEEITLDIPPGAQKLVVEAEVTTETDSSYVKLSLTADYYSTATNPAVNNATVSVNGIPFVLNSNGLYKPASPYTGLKGMTYNLNIAYNGKTYASKAVLEPMFRIDSIFQVFKPKEGFIREGWSVNYMGYDDRPKIKYTYFRLGHFDTILQRDSIDDMKIIFNNEQGPNNVEYAFELPFTRFKIGETCVMIFRSVDKNMNDFILAYETQTSGAPGPFQSPPANLPTNVTGGAVGYFATYDVVRKRYKIH